MSTIATQQPRKQGKLIFFLVFFLATAFVTYMKNAQIFDPTSPIAQHFAPVKLFLAVHGVFGAIALILGAFQFSNRLRARYLPIHRKLGYVYLVCVLISAPFSIPVAVKIHTANLVAASAAQSLGWVVTAGIAFYFVRQGNIAQHRKWMFLSYPYAMVFTVARLIIPIPPIFRTGERGIELVVWSTIFLAAFLPSILYDLPLFRARTS